jgi:amino acid permease
MDSIKLGNSVATVPLMAVDQACTSGTFQSTRNFALMSLNEAMYSNMQCGAVDGVDYSSIANTNAVGGLILLNTNNDGTTISIETTMTTNDASVDGVSNGVVVIVCLFARWCVSL